MVHSVAQEGSAVPSQTVATVLRSLSETQKEIVRRGCFSGDFTMTTVRALKRKGLFYHHITSPNGRCGPMELTWLGVLVRNAMLAEVTTTPSDTQLGTQPGLPGEVNQSPHQPGTRPMTATFAVRRTRYGKDAFEVVQITKETEKTRTLLMCDYNGRWESGTWRTVAPFKGVRARDEAHADAMCAAGNEAWREAQVAVDEASEAHRKAVTDQIAAADAAIAKAAGQ